MGNRDEVSVENEGETGREHRGIDMGGSTGNEGETGRKYRG